MIGIEDGAALEGHYQANDMNRAARTVYRHLRTSGHIASFLCSTRDSEAQLRGRLGLPPAELCGGGFEYSPQTRVLQALEAENERVDMEDVGEVVHVRLAGEVIGGGRQGAVRPLPERRIGRMKLVPLIRHGVGSPQG